MKKRLHYPLAGFLFSIFGMLSSGLQADNSSKPYWQDVQVVAVNKEYPRSSFMSYDNLTDALSGKFENPADTTGYSTEHGNFTMWIPIKIYRTTSRLRKQIPLRGMIYKFPETGKYKDMA